MAQKAIRPEKAAVVEELRARFAGSKAAVVAEFRGLTVAQATRLRRALREAGVEYHVVKNTLAAIAARQAGLEGIDQLLVGPTAVAFAAEDPVAPARALSDFARDHEQLKIRGGVLEGKVIDLATVKALAALPRREVLLARVLGGMQAPLYGFQAVLTGTLRNFVYALEAIRKQKEEAQA